MSDSVNVISEDEFVSRYPLRPNHLDPDACWSYGDGDDGCLFETFGEELDLRAAAGSGDRLDAR